MIFDWKISYYDENVLDSVGVLMMAIYLYELITYKL